MKPFDHLEEDAIKKLLEETAEQIQPNTAFTEQLEKRLKHAHIPKKGFNMYTLKTISATLGWALALAVLAIAFNWIASQIAPKNIPAANIPFVCPVTSPNGSIPPGETVENADFLGNDFLWTSLWPNGKVYMTEAHQKPDGSFSISWPWWRSVSGTLTIEGHRLDKKAEPLRADIPEGNDESSFHPSTLIFPTTGCWEVTGHVGDSSLTFVTEVIFGQSTPQPEPFSLENTPVAIPSTPTGELYQWNGQPLYLNAEFPEAPPEMKIYLSQDELRASVEDVQALAEKFGMLGEIYQVPGEVPDTTDYLMTDGNRQLRVRSDRYFIYYPDYAQTMYAFNTQEPANYKDLIDEFMQTHGLGSEYKIEYSEFYGGYFALPLTPDGFIIRHEHFSSNGYLFEFSATGILSVRSSLLRYDEVSSASVISAEETLNKLLDPANAHMYGVLSAVHSPNPKGLSWQRLYPVDQAITYYGYLSSTARSITNTAAYISLDGYQVTGNLLNIEENMPNTFVEATGQFHEVDGVKTFELTSWNIYDGYEEGYQGTIQQQGGQTVFITDEGLTLHVSDLPSDLSLPLENVYMIGVTHDGEFNWKSLDTRPLSWGGGGGGGGMGFYKLNLSGTPMPLPTNIPMPQPNIAEDIDLPRFEGQRGIVMVTLNTQLDGSQRMLYYLVSNDPNYPYISLEGEDLETLQAYHNRPVEIWGSGDHFDENGTLVVLVERFEIPFPDLQFQILKGTQASAQIEGNSALLFIAENGQSYVQLGSDCLYMFGAESMVGTGEVDEMVLIEALIVPDLTLGGYPTVCIYNTNMAVNPTNGEEMEMTITADQIYEADETLLSPSEPPTASIEKVELTYFTPDMRYPPTDSNNEPPYLQPVWIFSGHYSDGSKFEIIIQALKDEFLSPEIQQSRSPG